MYIGVYLEQLFFHSGSVALVWNPTTGRVIPQYHLVFDGNLSTVPYMEESMLPPNWEDLVNHLSEMDTPKYVNLTDTWLNFQSNLGALDQLSDPSAIVKDQQKSQKMNTPGSTAVSKNIPKSVSGVYNSSGNSATPSQQNQENQAVSNLFSNDGIRSNSVRAGFQTDIFSSNLTLASRPHDS